MFKQATSSLVRSKGRSRLEWYSLIRPKFDRAGWQMQHLRGENDVERR
jgi:hypothetical protein